MAESPILKLHFKPKPSCRKTLRNIHEFWIDFFGNLIPIELRVAKYATVSPKYFNTQWNMFLIKNQRFIMGT